MIRLVVILLALVAALMVPGCDSGSQDSPEATIAAARQAVADGHADRLGRYIYADTQDMRRLMNRFGKFLGNVQRLGSAIQTKFPEDVAALKAQAEQSAKDGKASTLLAQVSQQMAGQRRRRPPNPEDAQKAREEFDAAIKRLFADPYSFLRESETRLTTTFVTDDTVALMWDGKPVLAPLGMVMKRAEDGKWYFVLPTNAPGLSSFMPKTEQEFKIWGSLIRTFDNVVIDMTRDVEEGRITSLESVARKAGEKTFIPAALVMISFAKVQEIKRQEAKAAAAAAPANPESR